MRVYLAAPWVWKTEASRVGLRLEAAGHTLTEKWWDHEDVPGHPFPPDVEHDGLMLQAMDDLAGVFNAQVFVLLNYGVSEGKSVETGLALAYGTPIIIVGGRSNVFHYLPGVAFAHSVDEMLGMLPRYAPAYAL